MHAADMFFVIKQLQKSECATKSTGCQRKRNKNNVLATILPACTRPLSTGNSGAPFGVNCYRGCVLRVSMGTTRGCPSRNRRTFCKSNTIYIYIYTYIYKCLSDGQPPGSSDGRPRGTPSAWLTDLLEKLPSKSSKHTKQVFQSHQASLPSKSFKQVFQPSTCLEDLFGRLAWKTCLED